MGAFGATKGMQEMASAKIRFRQCVLAFRSKSLGARGVRNRLCEPLGQLRRIHDGLVFDRSPLAIFARGS